MSKNNIVPVSVHHFSLFSFLFGVFSVNKLNEKIGS